LIAARPPGEPPGERSIRIVSRCGEFRNAPFVLATLIVTVSYPSALAAEIAGVLPSGVLSFPAFIGFFTASAVLAIACWDYARKPAGHAPRSRKVAPQPAVAAPPAPASDTAWVHQTLSA
jgi:hypothetical protein